MQLLWVQSLGQEDSLEKERITHSSLLAWNISWTGYSPWVAKTWTWLNDQTTAAHCEELLKVRREDIESYWRDLRRKATWSDLNFNRIPPDCCIKITVRKASTQTVKQVKRPLEEYRQKMTISKTKVKAKRLHLKYTVLWRKSWESASILDMGCKRKWGGWCYIFWPEQWEERSCHLLWKLMWWAN